MRWPIALLAACGALTAAYAAEAGAPAESVRVALHAHNCYPARGVGHDRLSRAIAAAAGPVAIEQDLVWDPVRRQPVVSHETALRGDEPTLEEHFFAAVTPLLERALAEGRPDTWPRMVLHLDFKTNEPEHHAAVWALLGRYERFLTTAPKSADGAVQPFTRGPLLVLTEQGPGQERTFHEAVPVGGRLRLFGTAPGPPERDYPSPEARLDAAASREPEVLIPTGATNYRRWTNHSWAVIERGGQMHAGAWSPADRARLDAIVRRAHDRGLWVRFYTLNGHPPNDQGWSAGYNFGSLAAVTARWHAAIDAGVDFIATDQYEEFAALRARRR
ncbi:MAG: hypothetical protein R2708_02820 [Vicinamibacterales bacterium]